MICGKSHPVPLPGPEKHSPPLLVLLLALLACSQALWAGQEPMEQARNLAEQELAYREAIDAIESDYGAYGDGLSEQILGLGHVLQSQGRHQEALALLKRGVHLARINDGLYSPQQLPLLQAEIASHIALGQYDDADERQHYMYRVQVRSMGQGELRAQALMQQAQWQYNAYQLRLGQARFSRLMSMWDLYRLALNDIIDRKGEDSPELLLPLEGMPQPEQNGRWHIAVGHGFYVDGDGPVFPSYHIYPEEVVNSGWDYIALGHLPIFRGVCFEPVTYYCGSPVMSDSVALVELDEEAGVQVNRGMLERK